MEQYIQTALARPLEGMAQTDHNPVPDRFDPRHRMQPDQFPLYRQEIAAQQVPASFKLLFGIEADFYPGCEAYLRSWLEQQPFDLVLGSVHYLDFHKMKSYEENPLWDTHDPAGVWSAYFDLVGQLAETGLYDVVSHIDLPKKFGSRPAPAQLKDIVQPALDRVAAADMAIEINTSGLYHPIAETYPSLDILHWAQERNIPLVFGSDAHHPAHVGSDFPGAIALARQAGYTHSARFEQRRRTLRPLP